MAIALGAVALGTLLWLGSREIGGERATRERPRERPVQGAYLAEEPALRPSLPAPQSLAAAVVPQPEPQADAAEHSGYDPNVHPHPITPEHLRLYREVDLLDEAWQALRKRDFVKAREIATAHLREYPDSNAHMPGGLLILADCMERPGPETRARAQHYYDTRTYSQMRRRIRRLCLEVVPEH